MCQVIVYSKNIQKMDSLGSPEKKRITAVSRYASYALAHTHHEYNRYK